MSRDDYSKQEQEEDMESDRHPGVKNFSRVGYQAQHVVNRTLKGALVGALIGAAALGVGAAVLGWLGIASLGWVGWLASAAGFTLAGGAILSATVGAAALTGALWGGGIGAAISGVMGLSSAGEVADVEEDRLIAKYEQAQARSERLEALRARRDQQMVAMERQREVMGRGMAGPPMQPYGRGPVSGRGHGAPVGG